MASNVSFRTMKPSPARPESWFARPPPEFRPGFFQIGDGLLARRLPGQGVLTGLQSLLKLLLPAEEARLGEVLPLPNLPGHAQTFQLSLQSPQREADRLTLSQPDPDTHRVCVLYG